MNCMKNVSNISGIMNSVSILLLIYLMVVTFPTAFSNKPTFVQHKVIAVQTIMSLCILISLMQTKAGIYKSLKERRFCNVTLYFREV